MSAINVTLESFENDVLKSDKPVLVDFWAAWCGPCKMLSPIMEEIADERQDIKVCKVNIDEEGELAMQYNVMSIPTIIAFRNGSVVKRTVGAQPKQDILSLID